MHGEAAGFRAPGRRAREAVSWGPAASAPAPHTATAQGPGDCGPEFLAGYPRPGA